MIPWLDESTPPCFPPLEQALPDPNGLLAAGGSLAPEWLLTAYSKGIFPWFSQGEPILWWSPDPRLVLRPGHVRVTRSLLKVLRGQRFNIRFDTAFAEVMKQCAAPRANQPGTWITPAMQSAYLKMHELGHAHSVEAWHQGRLVGGLYGIALGHAFFGESMFSRVTDASKCCLVHLARFLEGHHFQLIDCQMTTPHLLSMGAQEMTRRQFSTELNLLTQEFSSAIEWPECSPICFRPD